MQIIKTVLRLVRMRDHKELMEYVNLFRENPAAHVVEKTIEFPYNGKKVLLSTGAWSPNICTEIFKREVYKSEHIEGKQVLDIGGSFGESAIYFSLNGAKEVFSVEPIMSMYNQMAKNFEQNGIENCYPILGMVGTYPEYTEIFNSRFWDGLKLTPKFTLKEIVDICKIKDGFLKSDCEGYENNFVISADHETLRKFTHIIMEYHYGYKALLSRLRLAGFEVSVSEPTPHDDSKNRKGEYLIFTKK